MIYQEIDGIRFKMGKQFDFDFLKKYGKAFHSPNLLVLKLESMVREINS